MFDVLIIGSGPAGLTAAIYASRANKKVGVVEGSEVCGQLMKTTNIENYPGFSDPVSAQNLMLEMYKQAQKNTEMIKDTMIDFSKIDNMFSVKTLKKEIQTKTIIIATGSSPFWLGIESKFIGLGVSNCATCDGAFFKNKTVAVIGGGNTALEESIYLSNITKKVYLIHRRNEFRGDMVLQQKIATKQNIEILTPYEATKFLGKKTLEGMLIQHKTTKETKELSVEGAFIAIGHKPNTSFLKNKIRLTKNGYIEKAIITEIPGLFAAGDVHDEQYRQAITAAGYGCMAAMEALRYIENL